MRIEWVSRVAGTAAERALPDPLPETLIRIVDLQDSVLVLGSRQSADLVDARAAEAAGVAVIRRHSGGGAVLLHPGASLWIDVLLPRVDEHWVDDVGASFHWLGEVWVGALAACGVSAAINRGGLEKTDWGSLVCFGALGPGEVVVAGRKVVGMSQRRTRAGARFQCLVYETWNPQELLDLLALTAQQRATAADDLGDRAAGAGIPLGDLARAVIDQLRAVQTRSRPARLRDCP